MSDSRVQQQQQQQRMEAERMQKVADKAARQQAADQADRQQFSQLMNDNARQTAHEGMKDARKKGAEEQTAKQGKVKKQTGDKKADARMRNARLARGGALHQSKVMAQAESFHSMLDAKKQETEGVDRVLHKEAEESRTEVKAAGEERAGDLDQKAEERREMGKHEARIAAAKKDKHNAAISGDKPMSDDGGERGGEHADEAGVDAAKKAAGKNEVHTEEIQGAAGAKQLPAEVIEALVKEVMVGIGPDGIATFRIELNDGVLQGATLQITAEAGKVGIDVAGLDANAKRLVQASVGQLQRGLEKRGLALDWLAVA
jgi:hypothetical protein